MYQFHQPADLILRKDGFEQWCTKINQFQKMVSPEARIQAKQLTDARHNNLLLSNDQLWSTNDMKTGEEIQISSKFQTSFIGGDKLWQLHSTHRNGLRKRTRPSLISNTGKDIKSQQPLSQPQLSKQFEKDTRLKEIVKFLFPKEKPPSQQTHKRLPLAKQQKPANLCSDHQLQLKNDAKSWDKRRKTQPANQDPISIEVKAFYKPTGKIMVTERQIGQEILKSALSNQAKNQSTDLCSYHEFQQNSPRKKYSTVIQRNSEQNQSQKEVGEVITQTQSQYDRSEADSPQLRNQTMIPIREMIDLMKRKPETSQNRTRIRLQAANTDTSAQYQLKVSRQASSQQNFTRKTKPTIDALQPQLVQVNLVVVDENMATIRPQLKKKKNLQVINRVLVPNKIFTLDAKLIAKDSDSGFSEKRIPPISTRFAKQKQILYPITSPDSQKALLSPISL